jgi:hypothetical protein
MQVLRVSFWAHIRMREVRGLIIALPQGALTPQLGQIL